MDFLAGGDLFLPVDSGASEIFLFLPVVGVAGFFVAAAEGVGGFFGLAFGDLGDGFSAERAAKLSPGVNVPHGGCYVD